MTELILVDNNESRIFSSIPVISVEQLTPEILNNSSRILDLTSNKHQDKEYLINRIHSFSEAKIISDLSCSWGDALIDKFPNLTGAMSFNFFSPENKCECFARNNETRQWMTHTLQQLNCTPTFVKSPGLCFTYPRVVSMIINEAFIAEAEGLASREDIDTAMIFGVNYPLGPFAWGEKIGLVQVLKVLETLFELTGDPRYRPALTLRREAL